MAEQRSKRRCSLAELRIRHAAAEQQDILTVLKRTGFNRERLDAIANCDAKMCGNTDHCRVACPFGRERRKLAHSRSIAKLLTTQTDLFDVQVSRKSWSCGLNDLDAVTIGAVINLNRRALDKIQESVLAAGAVKVFASPGMKEEPGVWRWEIHEIVRCSSRDLIEEAFSSGHLDPGLESSMRITEVRTLTEAINGVLSHDLVEWKHPSDPADPVRASKKWRREYYRWALRLNTNDLLIRYGCDRYFNRLNKPPRPGPQPKKPRRYPWQLAPYMYDTHEYGCPCRICINRKK